MIQDIAGGLERIYRSVVVFDTGAFLFINKECANPFFDEVMPSLTHMGLGQFVFLAALILMLSRVGKITGISLIAGMTVSYYLSSALKEIVSRPRPFQVLNDVNKLACAGGYSFPSGHSAMAFMAAFVITSYHKKAGVLVYLLAFMVGLSRVYIGVHFPSDVICGALIGTVSGYFVVKVLQGLKKTDVR